MNNYFKYYLKMAFMPFIYLVFSAMLGLAILTIQGNDLQWLQYLLCGLNLVFYSVIMCMAGVKDGQRALTIREQNDTYRRVIAQTGDDLPLNLVEEYTPWKGITISLLACVPSVLLVLVHFALNIGVAVPNNAVGGIAGILNMVVFGFFMIDGVIATAEYAFILLIVPFICLVYGVTYIIGAYKEQKHYDKIRETHKALHGDEN
jgi:hypothetical protein